MPFYVPSPWPDAPPGDVLQVFEKDYLKHNTYEGYWGPVQASIDWCERNYEWSHYVAEFFNTTSNALLIVMSLAGLISVIRHRHERRFVVLFGACLVTGLGSSLFHGTLTHIGQQGDETPMMYAMSAWIYCLVAMDPRWELKHPAAVTYLRYSLMIFVGLFTPAHYYLRLVVTFQVSFGVLVFGSCIMLVTNMRRCTKSEERAVMLGVAYIVSTMIGFAFWLVDVHLCDHMHNLPWGMSNPQFHAWWHLFSGLSCYIGPTFALFRRAKLLGRRPTVEFALGVLPMVVVHDSPPKPE